jgi:hypothetical protein
MWTLTSISRTSWGQDYFSSIKTSKYNWIGWRHSTELVLIPRTTEIMTTHLLIAKIQPIDNFNTCTHWRSPKKLTNPTLKKTFLCWRQPSQSYSLNHYINLRWTSILRYPLQDFTYGQPRYLILGFPRNQLLQSFHCKKLFPKASISF